MENNYNPWIRFAKKVLIVIVWLISVAVAFGIGAYVGDTECQKRNTYHVGF